MPHSILAFDLGAESGRAVVGRLDGRRVELDVVHRFNNGGVRLPDGIYWDALRLWEEIKTGLKLAWQKHGPLASVGIDTWGVDFALLGRGDTLLANPRHYRDPHTESSMEAAFAAVSREAIFARTGVQFMRFNSLFQLLTMHRSRSPILDRAESLLLMPDLFHFWLTGRKVNERTNAGTTQFYDPQTHCWATDLLDRFGLPTHILGELIPAGTPIGQLSPSVAAEVGTAPVPVIAPATHDTGSAVAAVPAQGESFGYISSGTWSLMGVELSAPIINPEVMRYNFTNEVGVGGTIRFLKIVMGLWLVQECRRSWERSGRSYSYEQLARLAEAAPPTGVTFDPDDPSLVLPADMPTAIADLCRGTGLSPVALAEPGSMIRCILENLAARYRWVLERLEELTRRRIDTIHVVGGGSQNRLLNQLTADACGRVVLAGPVEATALGNVLVQAIGLGMLGSLADVREVVRSSMLLERFEPRG